MSSALDRSRRAAGILLAAAVLSPAVPALAAEFHLVARPFTKTLPGGTTVPMWGFALDADGDLATVGDELPTAPGPVLRVPAGETSLTLHVRNELPQPVSIIVPGLVGAAEPVWVDRAGGVDSVTATGARPDGDVSSRARSLTVEVPPAQGGTPSIGQYTFTGLRPGTFLYESGTRPAVQVPMGLHGALIVEAAGGQPYADVVVEKEALLFYSEIDPDLNRAVVEGRYGTASYPSSMRWHARWHLVNGAPHPDAEPLFHGFASPVRPGERVLLRFVSTALDERVPSLLGGALTLVAEDGNRLPWPRRQHGLLLAPGKTVDALFAPVAAGRYPVYDRRLALSNAGGAAGGMLVTLTVADPAGAPVSAADVYDAFDEDTPLAVDAASGVLANDAGDGAETLSAVLVDAPGHGTLDLHADGSFTYAPDANWFGADVFTYRAHGATSGLDGNVTTVSLTVTPVVDAPVTTEDHYTVDQYAVLDVPAPGVLGNDSDPDRHGMTALLVDPPALGTVELRPDGSFTYSSDVDGTATFTYRASDGTLESAPTTVMIHVMPKPNTAPVAVDDTVQTPRNTSITFSLVANDRDAEKNLDPASVQVTVMPRYGTLLNNGNGTVTYVPKTNFRGTDTFRYRVRDTAGALSNVARGTVNVTRTSTVAPQGSRVDQRPRGSLSAEAR